MGSIIAERGRAEPLVFYPGFRDIARPTAADIRVGTPSTQMPDEGGEASCTVSAVNTTVSAAVRGDRSLVVASATGITQGHRYLVTTINGQKIVVTAAALASTTVYLDEPLPIDIASGSAFEGLAVTTSLTTNQTSELGTGHIVLRITLSGVVRRYDYELRIEARKFPLFLTTDDCLQSSKIKRYRPSHDLGLEDTIVQAWDTELRPRLRARGILEHRITSPGEIIPAHLRSIEVMLLRGSDASIEQMKEADMELEKAIDRMLASREFWYSEETTVQARSDERQHLTAHEYVRLSR